MAGRRVFAPNPFGPPEFLDQAKQVGKVDLTHVRLVTTWNITDLNVADVLPCRLKAFSDVAFLHLDVKGVKAQLDVVSPDLLANLHTFVDAVVEKLRKARATAWLEDQRDANLRRMVGRPGYVLQKEVHAALGVHTWRHIPWHHMDIGLTNLRGIVDCCANTVLEGCFTARKCSGAALATVPVKWREDLHELEVVVGQPSSDFMRGIFVRECHFHALKACRCGGLIAVQHGNFGEKPPQVGVKSKHWAEPFSVRFSFLQKVIVKSVHYFNNRVILVLW